jgi:hypothetical protein
VTSCLLCPFVIIQATTVNPPEFPDLVNQSDYIVRAVVKSVEAKVEQTARGRKIYTYVELEVREVIAGTPPSPLVLRLLGGRVGKDVMILEGAPQFKVGEEDILFVQGNGRQIYPLVAIMHGRYPVQRETGSGREFMARSNRVPLQNTSEVVLPMTAGSAAQLQMRMKNSAEALSPAEFIRQIRAAVKSSNLRLRDH